MQPDPSFERRPAIDRPATGSARGDERTLAAATEVLEGRSAGSFYHRLLPFLGPAFIASVAYVDPGNFATNIQGGAQFGYLLLWVIVASNLMAMLTQALSAKLGIATSKNLAEHCRDQFPRWAVWGMWLIMVAVAMATDLAEFLAAALGFNLLFGMPLFVAGVLRGVVTFPILALERHGFRPLEAVITGLVGVIAFCYVIETLLGRPDTRAMLEIAEQDAAAYVGGLGSTLAAGGLEVTISVGRGEPLTALLETARTAGADLVAIATHARGAMEGFWAGSLTPKLMRGCW